MSAGRLLLSLFVGSPLLLALACNSDDPGGDDDELPPPEALPQEQAAHDLAEQICAGLLTCDCVEAGYYDDEANCIDTRAAEIQFELDAYLDMGWSWNEDCAGELLWTWKRWACLGPDAAFAEAYHHIRSCPLFHGTLGKGEFCYLTGLGDPCAPGLACYADTCIDAPQLPVPLGASCAIDWDQLPCEDGSYCRYDYQDGSRTCVAWPQQGDPCDPNFDSLCGPTALDLMCDLETASCQPAPSLGEPCGAGFYCAPGFYCDGGQDFSCQPQQELGEGCGADSVCPADASCSNNVCVLDPPQACSLVGW